MYTLTLLGKGVRKHIFTDVKPSAHTSDNRITQGYDCLAQPAWRIFFSHYAIEADVREGKTVNENVEPGLELCALGVTVPSRYHRVTSLAY